MKNIIICTDGTWETSHGSKFSPLDTNVSDIFLSLKDVPNQTTYYSSGVGTYTNIFNHFYSGITGEGLFEKIKECYLFLVNCYRNEDKIYLFGFSRGAYTARSLAGMICQIGIPTTNFTNSSVNEIFSVYRERNKIKKDFLIEELKKKYNVIYPGIEMIGVWDTVGSLGIPSSMFSEFDRFHYGFLDTSLHKSIKKAYHAISIDEHRSAFQPTLWTNVDGSPRKNDSQLEQVWFPGDHQDVGGGWKDGELSKITLSYMMHKALLNGLNFNEEGKGLLYPLLEQGHGPIHDQWSFIPYGFKKKRILPVDSFITNSISYLTCSYDSVDYKKHVDNNQISFVLPYKESQVP